MFSSKKKVTSGKGPIKMRLVSLITNWAYYMLGQDDRLRLRRQGCLGPLPFYLRG